MIQRAFFVAAMALATLALTACGERPQQTLGDWDQAPHKGVGASQYVQQGWTPGDRNSWEQHLKTRAQFGQNEHTRIGN